MGRRRVMHDQAGASAVEFALILPILVLLFTGVIDIGRLSAAQMQVAAAARAGASYALFSGSTFDSPGITSAMNNATTLPVTAGAPVLSFGCPNASTGVTFQAAATPLCAGNVAPGRYVRVNASANYNFLFTWPGIANPMVLSNTSTVRVPVP